MNNKGPFWHIFLRNCAYVVYTTHPPALPPTEPARLPSISAVVQTSLCIGTARGPSPNPPPSITMWIRAVVGVGVLCLWARAVTGTTIPLHNGWDPVPQSGFIHYDGTKQLFHMDQRGNRREGLLIARFEEGTLLMLNGGALVSIDGSLTLAHIQELFDASWKLQTCYRSATGLSTSLGQFFARVGELFKTTGTTIPLNHGWDSVTQSGVINYDGAKQLLRIIQRGNGREMPLLTRFEERTSLMWSGGACCKVAVNSTLMPFAAPQGSVLNQDRMIVRDTLTGYLKPKKELFKTTGPTIPLNHGWDSVTQRGVIHYDGAKQLLHIIHRGNGREASLLARFEEGTLLMLSGGACVHVVVNSTLMPFATPKGSVLNQDRMIVRDTSVVSIVGVMRGNDGKLHELDFYVDKDHRTGGDLENWLPWRISYSNAKRREISALRWEALLRGSVPGVTGGGLNASGDTQGCGRNAGGMAGWWVVLGRSLRAGCVVFMARGVVVPFAPPPSPSLLFPPSPFCFLVSKAGASWLCVASGCAQRHLMIRVRRRTATVGMCGCLSFPPSARHLCALLSLFQLVPRLVLGGEGLSLFSSLSHCPYLPSPMLRCYVVTQALHTVGLWHLI